MKITVARLYHPAPWNWLYSYRATLLLLRILELEFIGMRYLLFRAPVLIVWTRLPGLRNTRPPFGHLGEVLAPVKHRASLHVGEAQLGSDLALLQDAYEADQLMGAFKANLKPPSRLWSVLGCVMRGWFTELGPCNIKFGQIMSMREEVPPSIRAELQLLQDKLAPMKYKEVKKILERELSRPVEDVFEWVEETPIAAASLSQVHRAKLRREQKEVALKIQRPYLPGMVKLDTVILCDILIRGVTLLLPLVRKSTDTGVFTTSYRESLEREIDFAMEGRTQERMRAWVMRHPIFHQTTKIANTYPEYTTTKLLTMELVKNYYRFDRLLDDLAPEQLWDVVSTKVEGYPSELPLQLLWSQIALFSETVLRTGLCHGDIHLGNLYLLAPEAEGGKWKCFMCDFGMMIEETEPERMVALQSLAAMTYYFDGYMFADAFRKMSSVPVSDDMMNKMTAACQRAIDNSNREVEEGKERILHYGWQRGAPTKNLVSDLLYALAAYGLHCAPFGWLFIKNSGYINSIGTTLWTTCNLTDVFQPHIKKFVKDWVMRNLENTDVSNVKQDLPRVLDILRGYDREQIVHSLQTGKQIRPKEKVWAHDLDVRYVEVEVLASSRAPEYSFVESP